MLFNDFVRSSIHRARLLLGFSFTMVDLSLQCRIFGYGCNPSFSSFLLGYSLLLTCTYNFSTFYVIQLTRARDGTNGIAYFNFDRPSMFDPKETVEETIQDAITSMRLVDEEGEIRSTDVSASFVNGQPVSLQVTHVMPTAESWERFIRFMDRYAAASELGFDGGATPAQKSSDPNPPRSQAV